MKKKIKDLTLEEKEKICNTNRCNKTCPLFISLDENSLVNCICDIDLEYKVEVDE